MTAGEDLPEDLGPVGADESLFVALWGVGALVSVVELAHADTPVHSRAIWTLHVSHLGKKRSQQRQLEKVLSIL